MEEEKDILKKIQLLYNNFSKSQRVIAQYILANYEKVAFFTAAKLAEKSGVSESTVVRFASVLGCSGYPQLQKELQDIIKIKLTTVQRIEMSVDHSSSNVLKNIIKSDINNLDATLEEIDLETFESAVEDILSAKHIYIIGMRSSTTLSEFLGFYLQLIRENVHVVTYSIGEIYEQLFRLTSEDLVIGIGFPRYSSKTVEGLEYAKSLKAKVLVITDSLRSPLAAFADKILIAKTNMESFVDSLVAPLSLLNAMIVSVGNKKKTNLSDSFTQLEDVWKKYNVYDFKKN